MKIFYDPQVDILKITFCETTIAESDEDENGMIFDYDNDGKVVAIEILDASQRIDNPQSVSYMIQSSNRSSTINSGS